MSIISTAIDSSSLEAPTARIEKRFGGRHLIFRTKVGGRLILPRPYLLISSFKGAVWVFYGAGQIWLTHKKIDNIENWLVRAPRIPSKKLKELFQELRPQIEKFIRYCNSNRIEGTIVLEQKVIEFHWTFGSSKVLEKQKLENSTELDSQFQLLVSAFTRCAA